MDGRKKRALMETLSRAREEAEVGNLTGAVHRLSDVLEQVLAELGPSAHADAVSKLSMPKRP